MGDSKWFTANLSEADALRHPTLGIAYLFGERFPRELFADFGINLRVVEPGQPTALYHSESAEEAFLVLAGECLAIVEGERLELRQWDLLHCPPDVLHVLVGAGSGPCWILMVGGRRTDDRVRFEVNADAARYGASVERATDDAADAWAQVGWSFEDFEPAPLPWPPAA